MLYKYDRHFVIINKTLHFTKRQKCYIYDRHLVIINETLSFRLLKDGNVKYSKTLLI